MPRRNNPTRAAERGASPMAKPTTNTAAAEAPEATGATRRLSVRRVPGTSNSTPSLWGSSVSRYTGTFTRLQRFGWTRLRPIPPRPAVKHSSRTTGSVSKRTLY